MPVYSNAILSVICLHLFINYKDFQNPFLLNYPVLSLHHILLNFSIFQDTYSFTSIKEFKYFLLVMPFCYVVHGCM